MPKYRGDYNPIDDPSIRDLKEGRDLADQVRQEIQDLYLLSDPYESTAYGYSVPDPEEMLLTISYFPQMIAPLPNLEQAQINKEIQGLVERVRNMYPAFVADAVERFGHAQSVGREARMSAQDIREVIVKAKDASTQVRPSVVEEFLATILQQEHRLALFAKEPRYYVFEREAEKLERELYEAAYPYVWGNPMRAIEDTGEAETKLREQEELFREAVAHLSQLVNEMQDPVVKQVCQETVKRLGQYLERFKKRIEEPGAYRHGQDVGSIESLDSAYQVLGFTDSVRPEKAEVRKRYIELAKANHPDIVGDEGTRRMAAINAAMQVLRETWKEEDGERGRH